MSHVNMDEAPITNDDIIFCFDLCVCRRPWTGFRGVCSHFKSIADHWRQKVLQSGENKWKPKGASVLN